jgi:hypothetical protein
MWRAFVIVSFVLIVAAGGGIELLCILSRGEWRISVDLVSGSA